MPCFILLGPSNEEVINQPEKRQRVSTDNAVSFDPHGPSQYEQPGSQSSCEDQSGSSHQDQPIPMVSKGKRTNLYCVNHKMGW